MADDKKKKTKKTKAPKKSVGQKQKQSQKVIVNINRAGKKTGSGGGRKTAPKPAPVINVTPQITIQPQQPATPSLPKPITNFPGQGVVLGRAAPPRAVEAGLQTDIPARGRAGVVAPERIRAAAAEAYTNAMRRGGIRLPAASSSPAPRGRAASRASYEPLRTEARPVTPLPPHGGGAGRLPEATPFGFTRVPEHFRMLPGGRERQLLRELQELGGGSGGDGGSNLGHGSRNE